MKSLVRVSITPGGLQGTAPSDWPRFYPVGPGLKLAFSSLADTFDPVGMVDNTVDLFLRTLFKGSLQIFSVKSNGQQSYGHYGRVTFSSDGRLAAYDTGANDLVANDTTGTDMFVRNMTTGSVRRVSVTANGSQANGISHRGEIAADSAKVVFASYASNLVTGDSNDLQDIFVKELGSGKVIRASVSSTGRQANGESTWPVISPNGRYVAFESFASNLVSGGFTIGVYLRDLSTGRTTRLGSAAAIDRPCCAFSADSSRIIYSGKPGAGGPPFQIYITDIASGDTELVSVSRRGGEGNGSSHGPSLSLNGRRVVFESFASDLVSTSNRDRRQIFVRDLVAGTTIMVSRRPGGAAGNFDSRNAVFSISGGLVAFSSSATNLIVGDTNSNHDVFVATLAN